MSDGTTSSSRSIFSSAEARKEALWWTGIAISIPVAGAAVWWLSEKTINRLAPKEASNVLLDLARTVKKAGICWRKVILILHTPPRCALSCAVSVPARHYIGVYLRSPRKPCQAAQK